MSESGANQLSNLKLSSDILYFSPESQSAELTLMNIHQSYHLYFKIKTKIEKVFEVKPAMGVIKAGEKQVVAFKPFKRIEPTQLKNLEQNLQFLIKVVNSQIPEMKREEEEKLWKEVKQHKHLQLGFCSIRMKIAFAEQPTQKQFVPLFNTFESRVDGRFSSNVRSSKGPKTSSLSDDSHLRSSTQKQQLSDTQLSKKYQQLKAKQDKLLQERQKIFGSIAVSPAGKKKSSSLLKLVIVFVVAFFVGNYLKSTLATREPQQKEKGFFEWFG